MSNLKTRIQKLERGDLNGQTVIVLFNSLERQEGDTSNPPQPFSKLLNGMKFIYANDDQDYSHLL
jgi:hypothetical protein